MPLFQRKVEPSYVSRGTLPEKINVQNDLEAVANGALSNVILQLSSLSHNAEEIFTGLVRSVTHLTTRSSNLQIRLDRLVVKANQLDGLHEEYSFQDCLNTKPFQSSAALDQQVVCRSSMPPGLLQLHSKCDRPPPLEKLNPYRDDGKDGLKFYTDPGYFFNLWVQEMLKDTDKAVRKITKHHKGDGNRRNRKHVRQPQNTTLKQKNIALQRGEHIMPPSQISSSGLCTDSRTTEFGDGAISPETPKNTSRPISMEVNHVSVDVAHSGDQGVPIVDKGLVTSTTGTSNGRVSRPLMDRESLPPPPPPPAEDLLSNECITDENDPLPPPALQERGDHMLPLPDDDLPPPPPTPDPCQNAHIIDSQKREFLGCTFLDQLPPAPPPPPVECDTDSTACSQEGYTSEPIRRTNHGDLKGDEKGGRKSVDSRSELLKAIRGGIALKKVEKAVNIKDEKGSNTLCDVAAILSRRVALEMSDSDSDSSDHSSDCWDETSA